MAEGKDKAKQVFDVSKPGKSLPSATSRPVITGHGPLLKDPMVSQKEEDETKETPAEEAKISTAEKIIAPPEEMSSTKSTDEDKKEEQKKPAKDESLIKLTEEAPEPKQEEPTEAATVDAVAEQAVKGQKNGPTPEDIARQQELEKMVEDKKYFVPIGQVTRRRNTRRAVAVLLLVLVLVLVGAYLALDSGLIESNIKLPFDLITN
jgi:hypothetical protein